MAGARQGFRCTFLKQSPDRPPLRTNVSKVELGRTLAGDDHQIDALREKVGQQAEALPAQPLDPVTTHRTAHAPGYHEAQTSRSWWRQLGRDEQGEVSSPDAAPGPLRPHELAVLSQPALDPHDYFL